MSTAFLATEEFRDKDSLSARIVQARFSGHFRFACRAFKEFMANPAMAAAGLDGLVEGQSRNPPEYSSKYDRNHLVYAAILFSESYREQTGATWNPSVYRFWNENCVEPNLERSPVPDGTWKNDARVYGAEDVYQHDVTLDTYGPLRVFGSLQQLRNVINGGTGAAEDFTEQNGEFLLDARFREKFRLQRMFENRICGIDHKYSVEDAFGSPPLSTTDITDVSSSYMTKYDMRAPGNKLGNVAVFQKDFEGCQYGSDCASDAAPSYWDSSLWQWAYVTSSHDPDILPGWHRLVHLKAWTTMSCDSNPNQMCKSKINLWDMLSVHVDETDSYEAKLWAFSKHNIGLRFKPTAADIAKFTAVALFGFPIGAIMNLDLLQTEEGRTDDDDKVDVEEHRSRFDDAIEATYINEGASYVQPKTFFTGLDVMAARRCNTDLFFKTGGKFQPCYSFDRTYPDPCYSRVLQLENLDREFTDNFFLDRIADLPPPPRPPPMAPPPLPPSPPLPSPPPSPPVQRSAAEVKSLANDIERQHCDSVYLLSATARCNRLALALQQPIMLEEGFSPPALPPIAPDVSPPPPPPSPPLPRIPQSELAHLFFVYPTSATLSTHFVAEPETSTSPSSLVGPLMLLKDLRNATRAEIEQKITDESIPKWQWAACSSAMRQDLLPCRTGDTQLRCLDGDRRCVNTATNMYEPYVDFDIRNTAPTEADYYFFAIEFTLPAEPEYAALLFGSVYEDEGVGYTIVTYDENHNPTRTQCLPDSEQSVGAYSEGLRTVQHQCLRATADPDEYHTMTKVRYVRLILDGSYRMIWLDSVRILFRTQRDLPPSPPPLPSTPPLPPQPMAPPDAPLSNHTCTFFENVRFADSDPVVLLYSEPCGYDVQGCCDLAYDHTDVYAFELSAAGCCTLYGSPSSNFPSLFFGIRRDGGSNFIESYEFGGAGTGIRDEF